MAERFRLTAEMEDGTVHEVYADQRHMARFEGVRGHGAFFAALGERPVFTLRWLAWDALVKAGVLSLTLADFQDQCVEVVEGEAEEIRPTPEAPSGEG